jgi:hypothetical protein
MYKNSDSVESKIQQIISLSKEKDLIENLKLFVEIEKNKFLEEKNKEFNIFKHSFNDLEKLSEKMNVTSYYFIENREVDTEILDNHLYDCSEQIIEIIDNIYYKEYYFENYTIIEQQLFNKLNQ